MSLSAASESLPPAPQPLPWEQAGVPRSRAWGDTFAEVLRHPSSAFQRIGAGPPQPAMWYGLVGVVIFSVVAGLAGGIPSDVASLGSFLLVFFSSFPRTLFMLALGATAFHGFARSAGGKAPYAVAVRTAAYASSAYVGFVPLLLLGKGPGAVVLAPVVAIALFWYGLRVTTVVATTFYGLPSRSAWALWAKTLVVWGLLGWLTSSGA